MWDAETRREPITKILVQRMHGAYTHAARNARRGTYKRCFGISSAASHRMPPSDGNYLAFASKGIQSAILYTQGSQGSLSAQPAPLQKSLDRSSQHDSGTSQASSGHPRCNLNLATSSAFLFLCRLSDAIFSPLIHAAINLQPLCGVTR